MKYRILPLVVVALALTGLATRLARADDKPHEHEGLVVKAGDGKLTMAGKDKKEHTHDVAKDAKITLDGKEAKLNDLKQGHHVKVTLHGDHGVVKIDAHSKDKKP